MKKMTMQKQKKKENGEVKGRNDGGAVGVWYEVSRWMKVGVEFGASVCSAEDAQRREAKV